MAQQTLANGVSYGTQRTKINENFTELYSANTTIEARVDAAELVAADAVSEAEAATAAVDFPNAYASQQDFEIANLIQNYKHQKSFVNGLSSNPTSFTRASSATYFDANGVMQTAASGAPRYTHDPLTLQPLGFLSESQATNLLLNSAALSTQSVVVTAQSYALSFYGTGSITLSGAHVATLVSASPARAVLVFTPTDGTLTLTVTGSVTNAQLEAGSFPTSYIPTTSAAVTRVGDYMTDVVNSGTYLNGDRGTVFADFYAPYINSATSGANGRQVVWRIRHSATNNFIMVFYESAKLVVGVYNGTSYASTYLMSGITTTQRNKVAVSYTVSGGVLTPIISLNGATVAGVTASGFSMPSPTLYVGTEDSTRQLGGTISRLNYFKRAMTQAELNEMTA